MFDTVATEANFIVALDVTVCIVSGFVVSMMFERVDPVVVTGDDPDVIVTVVPVVSACVVTGFVVTVVVD